MNDMNDILITSILFLFYPWSTLPPYGTLWQIRLQSKGSNYQQKHCQLPKTNICKFQDWLIQINKKEEH